MTACLEFAKRHVKESESMREKNPVDEIKIKPLRQNSKQTAGSAHHLAYSISTMKHGGGSKMLWGCFLATRTEDWSDESSQTQTSPRTAPEYM